MTEQTEQLLPTTPVFIRTPQPITQVEENRPLRISATAIGNPKPVFSWIINNRVLLPSNNVLMVGNVDEETLIINRVTKEFRGVLTVVAANSAGEARAAAEIEVCDFWVQKLFRVRSFRSFKKL